MLNNVGMALDPSSDCPAPASRTTRRRPTPGQSFGPEREDVDPLAFLPPWLASAREFRRTRRRLERAEGRQAALAEGRAPETAWRREQRLTRAAVGCWLLGLSLRQLAHQEGVSDPYLIRLRSRWLAGLLGLPADAAGRADVARVEALLRDHLAELLALLSTDPLPSLADRLAMADRLDRLARAARAGDGPR